MPGHRRQDRPIHGNESTQQIEIEVTVSGSGSPGLEEEEDSRPTVWRWHDGYQWRLYQDDMQVKIHQEYNRKKDGTCLVKKRDGSYRIYFKSMQEKSLEENIRHDVQRLHVDYGNLQILKQRNRSRTNTIIPHLAPGLRKGRN
ncbi:uncharacterized protein LOC124263588 [Haliotis rubra]|uniref:uncharacterized protein LOC124263588 n=1 Tax=Haliotis rubra TaxID=36100 RepID=UPI001EE4F1B6|nr:uncharacterized protein LOC124263588 [Haliotis rubra]